MHVHDHSRSCLATVDTLNMHVICLLLLVFNINGPILDMCVGRVMVMVFDATFDNISFISWHSVLLVEETGVPTADYVYTYTIF
jgi:hypothetical protein